MPEHIDCSSFTPFVPTMKVKWDETDFDHRAALILGKMKERYGDGPFELLRIKTIPNQCNCPNGPSKISLGELTKEAIKRGEGESSEEIKELEAFSQKTGIKFIYHSLDCNLSWIRRMGHNQLLTLSSHPKSEITGYYFLSL